MLNIAVKPRPHGRLQPDSRLGWAPFHPSVWILIQKSECAVAQGGAKSRKGKRADVSFAALRDWFRTENQGQIVGAVLFLRFSVLRESRRRLGRELKACLDLLDLMVPPPKIRLGGLLRARPG